MFLFVCFFSFFFSVSSHGEEKATKTNLLRIDSITFVPSAPVRRHLASVWWNDRNLFLFSTARWRGALHCDWSISKKGKKKEFVDWKSNDGNSRGFNGREFVVCDVDRKPNGRKKKRNQKTQLNVILVTDWIERHVKLVLSRSVKLSIFFFFTTSLRLLLL